MKIDGQANSSVVIDSHLTLTSVVVDIDVVMPTDEFNNSLISGNMNGYGIFDNTSATVCSEHLIQLL